MLLTEKKKGVRQNGQTPSIIEICSYCELDRPVFEQCQTLLHPELTPWWSFLLADGAHHKKPHSPNHPIRARDRKRTLMSRTVEHIEISQHLTKFAEKLIVEHLFTLYLLQHLTNEDLTKFIEKLIVKHLFYIISIATNKRTAGTCSSLRK